MNEKYEEILVERLWRFYDSTFDVWGVGFSMDMLDKAKPSNGEIYAWMNCHEWEVEQHANRIRFMTETPEVLEFPIEVDNVCAGSAILPCPVILDGHHRLAAHVWLGRKTIRARYGGRVDLLDYLTGASDDCPSD